MCKCHTQVTRPHLWFSDIHSSVIPLRDSPPFVVRLLGFEIRSRSVLLSKRQTRYWRKEKERDKEYKIPQAWKKSYKRFHMEEVMDWVFGGYILYYRRQKGMKKLTMTELHTTL